MHCFIPLPNSVFHEQMPPTTTLLLTQNKTPKKTASNLDSFVFLTSPPGWTIMRHLILSSQIQVLVTNSTVAIPAHLNDFRSLLPVLFACILSLYNSLSRRQTPNQIMIHPCWTLQKCFVVFRIILKFFTKFSTMHIMHSFLPLNLISYHYHIHYTQISLIFFLYFNWINPFSL